MDKIFSHDHQFWRKTLCTWKWSQCFIFFCKKEKLHKSYFLCDGQGHNALFTHWTDVTLFSAIRTHRGHLGHAKHAEKLNTWIFLRQKKNEDLTWKVQRQNVDVDEKKRDALSQVIASVIGEEITNPYPLHGADRHTGKDLFLFENFHHYQCPIASLF